MMMRLLRFIVVGLLCGAPAFAATLTSAIVVAPSPSINLTGAEQLAVTCSYSDGSQADCTSSVTAWSSSKPAVFTVNVTGVVNGVGQGVANVSAAMTGGVAASPAGISVTGYTTLTIASVSLALTGGGASVSTGATNQLIATCKYSDGSTTHCTSTDIHGNGGVAFTTSAPAIATASATGLVTGVAAGNVTFTVTVQ